MNFEKYLTDLCKKFNAQIIYHIEKPIIASGFEYEMHKQFDNEILIHFTNESDDIVKFMKILYEDNDKNKNYDYIEHFGDEIDEEYDSLLVWWK